MQEIIFNDTNDMLFMILMIFVHDFLHDFNVAGMAKRLSKIKSEINKLVYEEQIPAGEVTFTKETVSGEMAVEPAVYEKAVEPMEVPAQTEAPDNEYDDDEEWLPDQESQEEADEFYESEGEDESVRRSKRLKSNPSLELKEELTYLIKDIQEYEGYGPGEDGDFIRVYEQQFKQFFGSSEQATYFNTGPITRSQRHKISIYQLCDKFNQESKLQVINKTAIPQELENAAKVEKAAVAAQEAVQVVLPARHSARLAAAPKKAWGGNLKTRTRMGSRTSMYTRKSKPMIKISNVFKKEPLIIESTELAGPATEIKIASPNQHVYILNAINNVIKNTTSELNSQDHELVKYFEFMKKAYLYFKRKNADAFYTFNTAIDPALMLYLLTDGSEMFNDDRVDDTLAFIEKHYLAYYSMSKVSENTGIMLGGDGSADFYAFYEQFKPDLDSFNTNLQALSEKNDISDFRPYLDLINRIDATYKAEKIKAGNSDFDKYLQIREYKSLLDKTNGSFEYLSSQRPDSRNFQSYKKNLLFNASALIDHISRRYDILKKMEEAAIAAQEAAEEGGALSQGEANAAQMVSVTVAKIGFHYILNSTFPRLTGNEVFDKEIAIIKKVVETSYVPSTIDNNIRDAFMGFAGRTYPQQYLGTAASMKKIIDDSAKNKLEIIALNNAATESLIEYLKIPKKTHLCTTAQLADAMGTHGSCVGKEMSKKQELEPMDFILKDSEESKYYIGKTLLKKNRSELEQTIIYTAQCNLFFLPEVQIVLDTGYGKASLTLSANTSFKSVISTILEIWQKIFSEMGDRTSEKSLWDALINEKLYQRLISSGSKKSVGDFFQEINQVAKNVGYVNDISKTLTKQLRVGANGDQPSGVRAGYIKLKATPDSVNVNSIAGYVGNTKYDTDGVANDLYPSFFIKSNGFLSGSAASKKPAGGQSGGSKKRRSKRRHHRKTRKYTKKRM